MLVQNHFAPTVHWPNSRSAIVDLFTRCRKLWQVNLQTNDKSGIGLTANVPEQEINCLSGEEIMMKVVRQIFSIPGAARSAFGAAIVAVGVMTAASATAQTVTIGTTAQGSLGAALGAALAKVMDGRGMTLRAVPMGGPEVTIPLLNSGEIQFSLVSADLASLAASGRTVFEGNPQPNIRLVGHLVSFEAGWFVRADSDIVTMADLKGKRVSWGITQQRILEYWGRAQLATADLGEDDIIPVHATAAPAAVQDFMAGRSDAVVFTVGSGLVSQADAAVGGVRFVPLPDRDDRLDIITSIVPGTLIRQVTPNKRRPGVVTETPIMGSTLVLLASADTAPETVAAVTEALYTARDEFIAIHPAFNRMDLKTLAGKVPDLPAHDGAAGYYKANGITGE
ncbi:TAXI family TRAP transporter solute-binding subunit [Sulfitobacter sp. EhC04]|uniref:TAXI family TRAP transporter solute-binding subunit n=1 Tax=Sulfitobacter sp. EhC04 TaxID=1849168 RepID=UPI0010FEAAC7|nr:TAXI family TRAP transporter solute-binding subunit [Sulfitobacter sp. EhC04]